MSKRTRKSVARSCDQLWSHLVKIRANGRCERCGEMGRMESHHAHSRRDHRLRWELRNGVCFDFSCHMWAEQHPLEFNDWFEEHRPGDKAFLAVERAKGPYGSRTLADYLSLEESLKAQLDEAFPCEAA